MPRVTVTLDDDARARLIELAGGERKIGEYVAKLVDDEYTRQTVSVESLAAEVALLDGAMSVVQRGVNILMAHVCDDVDWIEREYERGFDGDVEPYIPHSDAAKAADAENRRDFVEYVDYDGDMCPREHTIGRHTIWVMRRPIGLEADDLVSDTTYWGWFWLIGPNTEEHGPFATEDEALMDGFKVLDEMYQDEDPEETVKFTFDD